MQFQTPLGCEFPRSWSILRLKILENMRSCWKSMFLMYWQVLIDNLPWKRSRKTLKIRHGIPQKPINLRLLHTGTLHMPQRYSRMLTGDWKLCPSWLDPRAQESRKWLQGPQSAVKILPLGWTLFWRLQEATRKLPKIYTHCFEKV